MADTPSPPWRSGQGRTGWYLTVPLCRNTLSWVGQGPGVSILQIRKLGLTKVR